MRAVVTGGIGGVVDTFGKSLKYATCFGKLNYGHKVHGAGRGRNEGWMRIKIGGQGRPVLLVQPLDFNGYLLVRICFHIAVFKVDSGILQ